MPHPIKAVLFDWGETLVLVPNMVDAIEQHIACLEKLYCEPRTEWKARSTDYRGPWPRFREAYAEATCTRIRRSHETRREHRFEDRFLNALQLAGVTQVPSIWNSRHFVDRFGNHLVREARTIDGATEVTPDLRQSTRVSVSFPTIPLIEMVREIWSGSCLSIIFDDRSVRKIGLRTHPGIYQHALEQIGAGPKDAALVGDDLDNDVVRAQGTRLAHGMVHGAARGFAAQQTPRFPISESY